MKKDVDVLFLKMLLENLKEVIGRMGVGTLKVHYMDPSKVADNIHDINDLYDPVKVPVLFGDFSVPGNQSLLTLFIGISGFRLENQIKGDKNPVIVSQKEVSYEAALFPLNMFYNNCTAISVSLSRERICSSILTAEKEIEKLGEKNEVNIVTTEGAKVRLSRLQEELLLFDKKFSGYLDRK